MKTYLFNRWEQLRTSYWFLPALMLLLAIGASFLSIAVDERLQGDKVDWLPPTDPQGARVLLSTIAASMIGVAGIVFSITIVALTLTSNQFGPRLLRNFMRDPGNQFALGTFTSTFMFCVLVLRRVRGPELEIFVPHLSLLIAVGFALMSIVVLIYFIHHMSSSIQAEKVVNSVSKELDAVVERLFPDEVSVSDEPESTPDSSPPPSPTPVAALRSGYVQAVDKENLIEFADQCDVLIVLKYRPGQHVIAGRSLAHVGPSKNIAENGAEKVRECIILGDEPSPEEDVGFTIKQLVEVAIRALSPALNDPFTAATCVDALGSALAKLAQRRFPSSRHHSDGALRLVMPTLTFAEICDAAFNQIRQYGADSFLVITRLLQTIADMAPLIQREGDRETLMEHAGKICAAGEGGLPQPEDQACIREYYRQAKRALQDDFR